MEEASLGILLIFGLGLFGGIMGAWLFERLRIPQVVGYIAIGLLLGDTGLQLIHQSDVESLQSFNMFALGVIGFLVGGELRAESFRAYGKQYAAIMFGEGVLAFVLVGITTGLVTYVATHNGVISFAAGAVFGAIASATDPASTVGVLWEYRAKGALTTALIAIVALDDALAMTLYGVGTSIAQLISGGEASILHELTKLCIEVGGAVVVGIVGGLSLNKLLRFDHEPEHRLAMATGILLLVIGVCRAFDMDIIIATMTVGILLVNLAPRRSHDLFALIRSFTSPIYVMFFVLVGARLALGQMPAWLWIVAAVYVVGRSAGKYIGAYLGATASKAEPVVRNSVGLGLFAQGGVAVGLSIMAGAHLNHLHVSDGMPLGDMIVYVVTATTLVVQIIGPPLVKLAARRAGELDRDITVKDVIGQWNVNDVLETDIVPVPEGEPLSAVVQRFSESDHLVYPVVGDEDRLVGVLSLEDMKDVLPDRDTWDWLLAGDVAIPPREHVTPDTKLKVALDLMADLDLEQIPVVSGDHEKPVGILDRRKAHRKAHEKVLRLQR